MDLDSHLMLFPGTLDRIVGSRSDRRPWEGRAGGPALIDEMQELISGEGLDPSGNGDDLVASHDRGRDDIWSVKGWGALGAQLAAERVEALDKMGIARQLVFGQFLEPFLYAEDPAALPAISAYNDFVLDWAAGSGGRLVPVCVLNMEDPGAATSEARRIIERGARAIQIPDHHPPAYLSPDAAVWDQLWELMAAARVPLVLHAGPSGGRPPLMAASWYEAADALVPPIDDPSTNDYHARPFMWMTVHLPAETMLTFFVLSGLLERHPGLRIGAIESGAGWVASWCNRMDTLAGSTSQYLGRTLTMKPSDYVRRQIRVTPFYFEPVGSWIETGDLDDVYVFSTDYPHFEGGTNPIDTFSTSLSGASRSAFERFFIKNGVDLLAS